MMEPRRWVPYCARNGWDPRRDSLHSATYRASSEQYINRARSVKTTIRQGRMDGDIARRVKSTTSFASRFRPARPFPSRFIYKGCADDTWRACSSPSRYLNDQAIAAQRSSAIFSVL